MSMSQAAARVPARRLSPVLAGALAAGLAATAARSAEVFTLDDNVPVVSGWDMASDDAYLGARAGCYESLTRVDFDGTVKPSLATAWSQPSPDVWEFRLREGVRFQDGTPLTAEAAANALDKLLNAAVPARAFSKRTVRSVTGTGGVVRVTMVEPSVLLPGQVASPATTILAPSAYKDGRVDPVNACTGPFAIAGVDPKVGMTLVRNDAYWGGKPALARAQVRFVVDANSRATQVRTGEADVARMVSPTALAQLRKAPNVALAEVQAPRTLMLLLNNRRPPLDDVRVRRAIQAAIDTAAIAAAAYDGAVTPAAGPFRPTDPWAPRDQRPAYDLARAKRLLAEAGVKPGSLTLGLWGYTAKTEMKDVAVVVQEMLNQVGIKTEIRIAEYNAIEPDLLAGRFDMTLMSRGYLTDVPEPLGFLNADFTCAGSFNIAHHCNPEFDAAVKAIYVMPRPEDRHDAYRGLAARLQDEAISVFLVHETLYDAYARRVANYRPHFINYATMTPPLAVK